MKLFVTTDTHFEHENIHDWCGRTRGYEEKIMKNLEDLARPDRILIHLGDVAWKNHDQWNRKIGKLPYFRKYLIKGNHDNHSKTWLLKRSWDWVGEEMTLEVYGRTLVFSHKPVDLTGRPEGTLNLHGHFHNAPKEKWEPELVKLLTPRHILVKLEHHYRPQNVEGLISPSSCESYRS